MRMIFEDSPKSALCKAVTAIYGGIVDDIIFVGGSGKLRSELRDDTIVYHDLVPDNANTSKSYKMTRRLANRRNNSVVIPVVCSEFVILSAFSDNVPDLSNIVLSGLYNSVPGITRSETYYKYLLGRERECLHDIQLDRNSDIESIFYKVDCPCGKCSFSTEYKLSDKYDNLVCRLPVFPVFETRNKINMVKTKSIIRDIEIEHNRLVGIYAQINHKDATWVDKALVNKLIV